MKVRSVLIIGLGQYGAHLAREFASRGVDVMVLSTNSEMVSEIAPYVNDAEIGDGTKEQVLRQIGIADFDACFVTIGEDFQSSLETTSLLKELGAKYIVSKATRDVQAKFLLRNGADEVVYPERDMAEKTAVRFSSTRIVDYIELNAEYSIFEMPISPDFIGKSLATLNIRKKFGVNVLAIKRNDGIIDAAPTAETVFGEGDVMLVLGRSKDVERLGK